MFWRVVVTITRIDCPTAIFPTVNFLTLIFLTPVQSPISTNSTACPHLQSGHSKVRD